MTIPSVLVSAAVVALAAQAGGYRPPEGGAQAAPDRCVSFASGRVQADQSFIHPIGGGLEFRLSAERGGRGAWHLAVGPVATVDDYLWVVSPPFRSAPHLWLGAAWHVTATQSAQHTPRYLRFVTSRARYKDAAAFADRAMRGTNAGSTVEDIVRKGRGTLEFRVIDYRTNSSGDGLAWVRVGGRACRTP
jgi:hypothetical protein